MYFESIAYAIACIAFGILACLFYVLWRANVRGSKECEEAAKFLSELDELEDPVEEAARFLRLEKEDVALEIKKGRLLKLVSLKVAATAATLKAPMPVWRSNDDSGDIPREGV